MIRKSYSILAVVVTAGCAGTAAQSVETEAGSASRQALVDELARTSLADAVRRKDHFSALCDGQGYPLPGNVNRKQAGTTVEDFCAAIGSAEAPVPAPSTPATSKPAPTPSTCDQPALARELADESLEGALANRAHYRCLCDDAGYPLVGNINAKGTTASQFCGALREKDLL